MKKALIVGNNVLTINQATMQRVIEAWLAEEVGTPLQVNDVKYASEGRVFAVCFETKPEQSQTAEKEKT